MTQEQNHPLYLTDRGHLNRLLSKISPQDQDLIDLARLLIRYDGFLGAEDLQADMIKILNLWGMTRDTLQERTKQIWTKGYRPGANTEGEIGSGFDTSDKA